MSPAVDDLEEVAPETTASPQRRPSSRSKQRQPVPPPAIDEVSPFSLGAGVVMVPQDGSMAVGGYVFVLNEAGEIENHTGIVTERILEAAQSSGLPISFYRQGKWLRGRINPTGNGFVVLDTIVPSTDVMRSIALSPNEQLRLLQEHVDGSEAHHQTQTPPVDSRQAASNKKQPTPMAAGGASLVQPIVGAAAMAGFVAALEQAGVGAIGEPLSVQTATGENQPINFSQLAFVHSTDQPPHLGIEGQAVLAPKISTSSQVPEIHFSINHAPVSPASSESPYTYIIPGEAMVGKNGEPRSMSPEQATWSQPPNIPPGTVILARPEAPPIQGLPGVSTIPIPPGVSNAQATEAALPTMGYTPVPATTGENGVSGNNFSSGIQGLAQRSGVPTESASPEATPTTSMPEKQEERVDRKPSATQRVSPKQSDAQSSSSNDIVPPAPFVPLAMPSSQPSGSGVASEQTSNQPASSPAVDAPADASGQSPRSSRHQSRGSRGANTRPRSSSRTPSRTPATLNPAGSAPMNESPEENPGDATFDGPSASKTPSPIHGDQHASPAIAPTNVQAENELKKEQKDTPAVLQEGDEQMDSGTREVLPRTAELAGSPPDGSHSGYLEGVENSYSPFSQPDSIAPKEGMPEISDSVGEPESGDAGETLGRTPSSTEGALPESETTKSETQNESSPEFQDAQAREHGDSGDGSPQLEGTGTSTTQELRASKIEAQQRAQRESADRVRQWKEIQRGKKASEIPVQAESASEYVNKAYKRGWQMAQEVAEDQAIGTLPVILFSGIYPVAIYVIRWIFGNMMGGLFTIQRKAPAFMFPGEQDIKVKVVPGYSLTEPLDWVRHMKFLFIGGMMAIMVAIFAISLYALLDPCMLLHLGGLKGFGALVLRWLHQPNFNPASCITK